MSPSYVPRRLERICATISSSEWMTVRSKGIAVEEETWMMRCMECVLISNERRLANPDCSEMNLFM